MGLHQAEVAWRRLRRDGRHDGPGIAPICQQLPAVVGRLRRSGPDFHRQGFTPFTTVANYEKLFDDALAERGNLAKRELLSIWLPYRRDPTEIPAARAALDASLKVKPKYAAMMLQNFRQKDVRAWVNS